ncbi:MAG: MmgE/PrpD family protein, partial [Pseudodonghicola sp.]
MTPATATMPPTLPGATRQLAAFAAQTRTDAVPPAVRDRALALTTDLAGSAIRAAEEAESTPALLAMLRRLGMEGDGPCSVFGLSRRYGPAAAALLNGAFGHSLDFDDTHADSSLHPSAPVVPAALAAAQMTGASGQDFLAAVVVGFEVCCRLGLALNPTAHYARGFHPTATAGTFGAAAAAGRLLGLDTDRMEAAFGVAASQASGSLQFLTNGAWNKRYQVGEAAMKGLMAATLAAEGFHGAADAIEGEHGFLRGYSDGAEPERATAGLGTTWETLRIGVKPYPACRYTHAAVDGLLALRDRLSLAPEEVEAITVGLHRNGITLVGAPLEQKRRARSVVEGQFSMPFAAAVALLRGRFGWDDYDLLGDPHAEALADRVEVIRDDSLEGLRHPFGATLELRARGENHRLRIPDPSGEPETF